MADGNEQVLSDSDRDLENGGGGDNADAGYEGPTDGDQTSEPQAEANYEEPKPSAPGGNEYEEKHEPANVELQALSKQYSDDAQKSETMLAGKYVELECDGKIVNFKVKSVGDVYKDTTSPDLSLFGAGGGPGETISERTKTIDEEKKEQIGDLVPDSTNAWLYMADIDKDEDDDEDGCGDYCKSCSDNAANKFIAIFVILLQIAAYIAMTAFLVTKRDQEFDSQAKSCYGEYCGAPAGHCMGFGTGGLTSILLVGFLWADVVNTVFLIRKNCQWAAASVLVLMELFTAIICGFLVGVYSETDFDAIGGAVGILFVHDLDEKVYASMLVFRTGRCATFKKILAIALWIILSVAVALGVSCKYTDGALFGTCKVTEFECKNGDCIWEGFQCNGIEDCTDTSDEGTLGGCNYALHNKCPVNSTFQCVENGACIDSSKRCNGVLDCPEGSDEGRGQNCSLVIAKKKCSTNVFNETNTYPDTNDTYHKTWSGVFKCNNGQCINAKYACDGQTGDCVDGSDEYPDFYKGLEYPFMRNCPYATLVKCSDDQVLCKVNGQCIQKTQLCDGAKDCPDGADEKLCEYSCKNKVLKLTDFQCSGQIAKINKTAIVKFYNSSSTEGASTIPYSKVSELDPYFVGSTGKCIPESWRCDGTNDCDDGSDEELCGLFTCDTDEYQCTDSGTCIPKSWLCDGINDCANKLDENKQICTANGVSVSGNQCITDGYNYQCQGYSSICLYYYNMCDGYQDCPNNDDETESNCQTVADSLSGSGGSSTSTPGGTTGSVSCGGTITGTSTGSGSTIQYTFTLPSGMPYAKISTCVSANTVYDLGFGLCDSSSGSCIYPYNTDSACSGCTNRYSMVGVPSGDGINTYTVTPGTTYTVFVYAYYSGTYALSVTCSATDQSSVQAGGTCSNSVDTSGGGSFGTTSFGGFGTTSYGGSGTTSGGGGGSGTTSGGGGSGTTSGGGGSGTTLGGGGTTLPGTTP